MDFTWLVWAVIAGLAFMAMLERKVSWVARTIAALVAVGFAYNAAVALFDTSAWLSWIAIALAVWATIWARSRRDQRGSSDEDDE